LLMPYERVKILRQRDDDQFEEVDVSPPGGAMEQPWLSITDVDGDGKSELLLPQRNFLRAVVLQPDPAFQNATNRSGWVFKVKDQINGAASNSRLVGAAALPSNTNNAVPALFLL